MGIREEIRPVTYLKNRASDLLGQINETRRPVIITQNGEPRGVLQDPVSYEQMRNAIGLLKLLVQGEEDLRRGRTVPAGEVFPEVRERLRERNGPAGEI
jgi:prevent-host-death family protein